LSDLIAIATQWIFTRWFYARRRCFADRLFCRNLGLLLHDRRSRSRFRLLRDKSIAFLTSNLIGRLTLLLLLPE
jgi:hypothetical protein